VKFFSQKLRKILLEDQLNWKLIFQGTKPTDSHEKFSFSIEYIILVINAIKAALVILQLVSCYMLWTSFFQSI